MKYAIFTTAWGAFGLVAHGRRLIATFLPQSEASLRRAIAKRYPAAIEAKEMLPRFRKQVINYFAGKPTKFAVDADLSAVTPFRQRVLEACGRFPYGKTATYADLARAAGRPGAARAVGGVMASNPLPLVIPCHRVLRSDGSLGGFSSPKGTREKDRLLALEGTAV